MSHSQPRRRDPSCKDQLWIHLAWRLVGSTCVPPRVITVFCACAARELFGEIHWGDMIDRQSDFATDHMIAAASAMRKIGPVVSDSR